MARTRLAALLAATALAVSGCGFTGIYDLPLPGGADTGDHPYRVKVRFHDVLDLVPQSGVKVNEVAVGRVEDIALTPDGWNAEVTLLVNGDVDLPANAFAKLRQSSLLGEKFVELSRPPAGQDTGGRLVDGAVIPLERTNRNTEVEEVLGALSMLLNGGGVEQLRDITRELNAATAGNETNIRALLDNVNRMVTTLDAGKADITRALDGVNRLAVTLNGQKDRIVGVVDGIGPGLQVLTEQRGQLVTMLQSLDALSGVAVDTVNRSQADLVADLKALTPTLRKLGEAGDTLPRSLELMFTFPFTDQAAKGVKGDYFNLYAKVDLNLQSVLDNLSRTRQNPLQDVPIVGGATNGTPGVPTNAPPPLPIPVIGGGQPVAGNPVQPGQTGQASGLGGLFDVLLGGGA
ncbi:MCE family protein [Actinokineospora auranticolor]|uniref:Phospholipid/cholesterol/gamma-HCH transport system substrate-binding protein n=1 Tax=Actinokineospora auranticolor TaxID=155976 RepID=A0A2S6GWD3_9PSEU|nr:MCE family protein [Actinokineospora auranticolor]PPK69513.1 phospholipid/cholesterol/gamma-HCH transport system substrate-binding protein [Actinokineospora auranticolor]